MRIVNIYNEISVLKTLSNLSKFKQFLKFFIENKNQQNA